MKIVWICGLPNDVRLNGAGHPVSPVPTAAWSWILGHLPPPAGVELHILCPVLSLESESVEFDYQGAHWHCVRQERYEMFFLWRRVCKKMRRIVSAIKPDVIHGWGGETGCGYLATLLSRRAVVSVQGLLLLYKILIPDETKKRKSLLDNVKERLHLAIERWSYDRAHIRLVESHLAHDALAKYYKGLESIVVPHPLRSQFLDCESAGIDENCETTFLFLGALVKRKGALDAVNAFIAANLSKARLVMIGDGPLRKEIEDKIAHGHLEDRIVIHSSCSAAEIVSLMKRSQFFLLPSYGDTGPTALKEALACGLYPICYDNSGPHELITRYCGRLVKTGNVDLLSAAIAKVGHESEALSEISRRVSERVRKDLSRVSIWEKLLSIYSSVEGGDKNEL